MKSAAVLCLAGVLTLPTIGDSATAQPWPSRPITVISPFSAGSGVDLLARHVANALSEQVHQPVIVDDRPGANGNVGAAAAAKADPDGYTLLIETPGIAKQHKKYLLRHVLGDRRAVAHMQSEAIHLALATPVQRAKCLFVSRADS